MSDEIPVIGPPIFDSSRLRAGMVAGVSGIYRVHHYRHRSPHMVFIAAGTVLPQCRRCGDVVQFAPLIAAAPLQADDDFEDELDAVVAS